MRVTLPVEPRHKTSSEVATIKFVRQNTDIPVPRIIDYNSSNQNILGFEWILMEMMPGEPLAKRWRKLSMPAKEALVERIFGYQAQLFRHKLTGIGNLYKTISVDHGPSATAFHLGQIVSMAFFWDKNRTYKVPRGPFENSAEWLHARLTLLHRAAESVPSSADRNDVEDADFVKELVARLLALLPRVFPPGTQGAEPSSLFHDNISFHNVLADKAGHYTA